ncbi:hypothetical protein [Elizabethkingia anophelis]|uniref:hypothetical protein n=1 Tax=Elizabethkingia anophelis TaxID=1117645 RepID=UPI0038926CD4
MKEVTISDKNGSFKELLKDLRDSKIQYSVKVKEDITTVIIPIKSKKNINTDAICKLIAVL